MANGDAVTKDDLTFRDAFDEIIDVMERYDLMGVIVLADPERAEVIAKQYADWTPLIRREGGGVTMREETFKNPTRDVMEGVYAALCAHRHMHTIIKRAKRFMKDQLDAFERQGFDFPYRKAV